MASEGKTPRRGREPRAIDASATEVATGPQQGADEPPSDAPAVSESASEAAAAPVSTPDAPAARGFVAGGNAAEAAAPAEATSEPSASERPSPCGPPRSKYSRCHLRHRASRAGARCSWPMLASAILGAVLGLAALAVIWRYNVLEPYNIDVGGKLASARPRRSGGARARDPAGFRASSGPAAVAAPVVSAPPPAVTKALDELTARVAKLEAAVQNRSRLRLIWRWQAGSPRSRTRSSRWAMRSTPPTSASTTLQRRCAIPAHVSTPRPKHSTT